jgi:hypothetical protein
LSTLLSITDAITGSTVATRVIGRIDATLASTAPPGLLLTLVALASVTSSCWAATGAAVLAPAEATTPSAGSRQAIVAIARLLNLRAARRPPRRIGGRRALPAITL